MKIEIRKVGFLNKGAALMLYAVSEKMRSVFPGTDLVMEPNPGSPFRERAALGLLQKASYFRHKIQWGYLSALIPNDIREMYGLVLDNEIDVVLDAAGFAYSGQIGSGSCHELAKSCKKWKKRGKKIILLPQAFGPFDTLRIKRDISSVVENADLIFARESVSYYHLVNVVGERENIKIAPDFTNLVSGELPEYFHKDKYEFCIVPNVRMINKVDKDHKDYYIPFMQTCLSYLIEKGRRPFLLIHEGDKDLRLAEKIVAFSRTDIPIICENDPLKVKGILGAVEGVIGSRYHGLISALSQHVPTLGTSWSHKYNMLFEDYGFPEGLITINADEKIIREKLDMIMQKDRRNEIIGILARHSEHMKRSSEEMWKEVIKVIDDNIKHNVNNDPHLL